MPTLGIDASSLQGQINWGQVKSAGYEFVICRNGVGNSSIDSDCISNVKAAQDAGLKTGYYNFAYPLPTNNNPSRGPKNQAQYHFAAAPKGIMSVLDIEWPAVGDWSTKWGITDANFIVDWILNYLETYESLTGKPMVIYSYAPFIQSLGLANCPWIATRSLWLAAYTDRLPACPKPWSNISMWQDSGSAKIPGCKNQIDSDICYDMSIFDVATNVSTNDPVIHS
jgi:GH25 family lysozyme M1 (1,4-beta-N-acetylmuramidase)